MALSLVTGTVISKFIGKQIVSQAISDASGSIYNSIRSIYSNHSKIDNILMELDIIHKTEIIDSLIKEIKHYNYSIEQCLTSVHDIIINIKEDLNLIDLKIKKHKKKYLSKWRKINVSKEINNLIIHNKLVDKRLDYLLKALKINEYNYKL